MTHGLVCDGVDVVVGGTPVLRDVDLAVPPGTMTAVVGPSGAGKTTLLRAVAGLAPTARGRVSLDGRDVTAVPTHRRGTAVVFQEPRLLPHLSVAENVALPLRLAGTRRDERRRVADGLLDEVGLGGTGDRGARTLSGGEAQRVALARALAGDPVVLLLDEPLAAVDPARRADLRRLVRDVQRGRRLTTLFVTHDRVEAAEVGDHVAVVLEGRVVAHATPDELFERPPSAEVARFLGADNVHDGEVVAGALAWGGLGSVPVDGPDGRACVVVRPEWLVPDPDGPLVGTVREVLHRGTQRRVELSDAGRPPLVAHLPVTEDVAVADRLRLRPTRTWRVPTRTDHPAHRAPDDRTTP